jgi:LysM repeat protein
MTRGGLVAMAVLLAVLPAATVACGDDEGAADTLPPIATTTSTTIVVTTTTAYVPVSYEIQSGDSLRGIAQRFGVDVDKLQILNGITNPDAIEAGAVLQIPPPTLPPTTTTAP